MSSRKLPVELPAELRKCCTLLALAADELTKEAVVTSWKKQIALPIPKKSPEQD